MKSLVFWTFSCDIAQRELKFAADPLTRASYQRR
jgi:hypothetical protein